MGDTPSEVGARAELAVATALSAAGKRVYVPLFNAHGRIAQVFLVPISDVASRYCYLRLSPARNGQERGVHWAADYRLG